MRTSYCDAIFNSDDRKGAWFAGDAVVIEYSEREIVVGRLSGKGTLHIRPGSTRLGNLDLFKFTQDWFGLNSKEK